MDDLFGITELVQRKNADPEQGSATGGADKAAEAHIERMAH